MYILILCENVIKVVTPFPFPIFFLLNGISKQVETADSSNFSALASNMQILTSVPDQLTTQNISAAANIAVQIPKKPNVPEESQVRLIKIKIRLLWLNIWDINSVLPLVAEGTLSFLLTAHNTTTKCIHFAI